ncbi:hypothetical protein ACIQVO_22825 [Streptomyces sp. NPDC101062]|uniref:hypothetical protein n=1 Tax=unclassified Streptomyces TaxID=2593676 RepID=UPI00381D7B20
MAVIDAWGSVNVSLAVMKDPIDAPVVCGFLGVDAVPSEPGVLVTSGQNWWAYTYGEDFGDGLESKVVALVDRFKPRLGGVGNLLETGHAVQVAIAGSVSTGSQLFLSPRVIGRLASLAMPISVTSLMDAQEEDPLGWLDD